MPHYWHLTPSTPAGCIPEVLLARRRSLSIQIIWEDGDAVTHTNFIGRARALRIAERSIWDTAARADRLFARWREAAAGEPVLVRTVGGEASYWLVPAIIAGRAAGFVRVMADGQVAAVGAYYRDVAQIAASPRTVTQIDAAEAARLAAERIDAGHETAATPIYVHDGPPGREAWLIEVRREGRPTRWIFATRGGVYERSAGDTGGTGLG